MFDNKKSMYALWFYNKEGNRSTNVLSSNKDLLLDENIPSISNKYFTEYKNYFVDRKVEPIKVYLFQNECLTVVKDINDIKEIKNGNFYASYEDSFPFMDQQRHQTILREVLVYMSESDHILWLHSNREEDRSLPSYLYHAPISMEPVIENKFYKYGILNTSIY